MNSESSRSHLCCILNLQIQSLTNGEKISSKLHLIDLAGSEMVRKTSAQGMRLNEAKFINKSLSALGNVINALTSTQLPTTKELSETHSGVSSSKHIPYRDSKLTRLLQDSLSGNSKTILLLTISLATEHLPETLSTLRFGERARKLKTKPRINVEQNDLNAYKQNYLILEKQFLSLKGTIDEMKRELEHKDRIISELRENSTSNIINQSLLVSCANCQKLEEIIHNLRKCSTSQTQSPITKVSNVSIDERAHVSDNNRSYPLSPSPIQEKPVSDETRCAVCGLNEIETEQLRQDTGESLGGFFTCDGNCGNIFHVRCAGEIGEGGQYTVPSGEWYCTTCSVLDDDQDRKILPPHVVSDGNSVLGSDETVTDSTLNSQQYLRVLSEYHKIRRERNRILNQWQHEQRLMKHRNDWRDQKEFELNQELITAKEIINKLQDDMCGQIREQKNLEKRLSDAVTELLLLKNEKLKNETASLSLVEITSTPAPIESFTSPNTSHQQKLKNSSGSQNPYTSLNVPAVEIPKPWIKKSLKKSGSSSVQEESKSINDAPVDSVPRHNSLHRESTSSPQKGKNRLPTSPIRQHSLNSSIEVPTSTSTSLDLPSLSFSENPELLSLSTPLPSSLSTSSSKSPFNKRLINLIQIVKEETGSFAEIRKKYKERETERSLLKSRHHKINPLTEEERGSSRKQIRENIVELERRDIVGNDHDGDRSGFDQWTIFPSL